MNKKEGLRAAGLLAVCLIVVAGVLAVSINDRRADPQAEFSVPQDLAGIEDILQSEKPDLNIAKAPEESIGSSEGASTESSAEFSVPLVPSGADVEQSSDNRTVSVSSFDLDTMRNPVGSNVISMAFSYNAEPIFSQTFNEYRSDHTGVDIQAELGTEVRPAFDGTVSEIRQDPKLGIVVVIQHADNVFTEYGNLDEANVEVGDEVDIGDVIGTVGNTALFESVQLPHLHFGLKVDGVYKNPIDYMEI